MKKTRRAIALILTAFVMAAALCGCGGGKPTEIPDSTEVGSTGEPVRGGEITVGIAADLDSSLDPHVSSSAAGTKEVLFNIFEGLVKPDTEGNLIPAVAESVTVSETGDTFTFKLREGIRFHNALDDVTATKRLFDIFVGEYLKEISEPDPGFMKARPEILRIAFWEGYRGFSRIYVETADGSVYYDVISKGWETKDANMAALDMEWIESECIRMTGSHSREEFARFKSSVCCTE